MQLTRPQVECASRAEFETNEYPNNCQAHLAAEGTFEPVARWTRVTSAGASPNGYEAPNGSDAPAGPAQLGGMQ